MGGCWSDERRGARSADALLDAASGRQREVGGTSWNGTILDDLEAPLERPMDLSCVSMPVVSVPEVTRVRAAAAAQGALRRVRKESAAWAVGGRLAATAMTDVLFASPVAAGPRVPAADPRVS